MVCFQTMVIAGFGIRPEIGYPVNPVNPVKKIFYVDFMKY